jgi:hypothetical protein
MEYISNPFVIAWLVLGVCVGALAIYRKFLANREDDMVHLVSGESKVSSQITMAERLQKIDFWGKTLTIVLAVYGLALLGIFIYRQYNGFYTPVG